MSMFFLILISIVSALIAYIALVPDDFRISRSTIINAPPDAVFPQINDFHNWAEWSPWEKIDPAMKRTFDGSPLGVGSSYGWSGDRKVGTGEMKIVESMKDERIKIKLMFKKPYEATNDVQFDLKPIGEDQTEVSWAMSGRHQFMSKTMTRFMNFENMIGGQYDQGLANLKALVEGRKRIAAS